MIPISNSKTPSPAKEYIELLDAMAKEIKYGSIIISIQDGKIVQIEKNEKIRLKN